MMQHVHSVSRGKLSSMYSTTAQWLEITGDITCHDAVLNFLAAVRMKLFPSTVLMADIGSEYSFPNHITPIDFYPA